MGSRTSIRPRIAYVTIDDATDLSSWSGSAYHIGATLQKHVGDVTYIGNLKRNRPLGDRAKRALIRATSGKDYFLDRTRHSGEFYARQIEAALEGDRFDLVFAAGAAIAVAYLKTSLPLITWADATFARMAGYYFRNLSEQTMADGHQMERLALQKASMAIFASTWAAESAVGDYGAARGKVHVVPFGANLPEWPARERLKAGRSDPLDILFIGKEWERKGGAIACDAVRVLRRRGIAAVLNIVGCDPPGVAGDPAFVVHGFLDKRQPEHLRRLGDLLGRADFLLVPSKEECYGVVVCEASAYGLPVIAHDTGGLSSLVVDGRNGFLARTNTPETYAGHVMWILESGSYSGLRRQARAMFDETLNWDASGRAIAAIVAGIVGSHLPGVG